MLSDLHTEFAGFVPPATDADAVILAGDIGVGLSGIDWASGAFSDVPIMYVPGNHEYYGHDISLTAELKTAAPEHIHVLNNECLEVEGARFLGCTLWTDFRLYGEGDAWFARQHAKQSIADFACIRNAERRFTPADSVELHENSKEWLVGELSKEFTGPTVVVTHHLPASASIAKRYTGDPLNPAFASSLEDVIEKYRPALWIHGHTHVPCDYVLFDTRVVCNPRGYPGEYQRNGFRGELVISVQ